MPNYSTEFKDNIVRKMMPPNSQKALSRFAKRQASLDQPCMLKCNNIDQKGSLVLANPSTSDQQDSKSKLAAIIQTALMNEVERAEYCRQHGLYPEQLNGWKTVIESTDLNVRIDDLNKLPNF